MVVAQKDPPLSVIRGEKKRILVVEDDGVALDLLEEILKRGGFSVSVAQSYDEALDRLASDGISLILTDLKMPGNTGMDLLKTVKNHYPDLPVIILTAFGDEHLWVEALSSGAAELIPKPFKKKEILEVVQRILSRSQP